MPHTLLKKLRKSSNPSKEELSLCLREMMDESGDEFDVSQQWVTLMDRGSLKHVNNATFEFFLALEEAYRKHLGKRAENLKDMNKWLRENDMVQLKWSELADNWDEEESDVLLTMILDLWVSVRGHSTAGAWLEKYKIASKQSLQKSKGIRAKVTGCSKSSNED